MTNMTQKEIINLISSIKDSIPIDWNSLNIWEKSDIINFFPNFIENYYKIKFLFKIQYSWNTLEYEELIDNIDDALRKAKLLHYI